MDAGPGGRPRLPARPGASKSEAFQPWIRAESGGSAARAARRPHWPGSSQSVSPRSARRWFAQPGNSLSSRFSLPLSDGLGDQHVGKATGARSRVSRAQEARSGPPSSGRRRSPRDGCAVRGPGSRDRTDQPVSVSKRSIRSSIRPPDGAGDVVQRASMTVRPRRHLGRALAGNQHARRGEGA